LKWEEEGCRGRRKREAYSSVRGRGSGGKEKVPLSPWRRGGKKWKNQPDRASPGGEKREEKWQGGEKKAGCFGETRGERGGKGGKV